MTIHLSLDPATEFSTRSLGNALFDLTHEPKTRKQLKVDFPGVIARYETREKSLAAITQQQKKMYANPYFQLLVVQLGESEADKKIRGVIALTPSPVPIKNQIIPGLNFAMWLSAHRAEALCNITPHLVKPILNFITKKGYEETTVLWTIARPKHPVSTPLLSQKWDNLHFRKVGKPQSYRKIDGVWRRRQLYVSPTLQEFS